MRFDKISMEFQWDMGADEEDRKMKELDNESSNR